jgi:hypothetical protein
MLASAASFSPGAAHFPYAVAQSVGGHPGEDMITGPHYPPNRGFKLASGRMPFFDSKTATD